MVWLDRGDPARTRSKVGVLTTRCSLNSHPAGSPEKSTFCSSCVPRDDCAGVGGELTRHDLARNLLEDICRLDTQVKESHKRIAIAVKASSTTLTELFGVGPMIAATVIGNVGDVHRFRNHGHFADYTGTARSSTPQAVGSCTVCLAGGTAR